MSPMRRRTKVVVTVAAGVVAVLGVFAVLVFTGVLWPGRIAAAGYDVRGVDVSVYQGEIDWTVLAAQDIDFAYIKATEGSSWVDPQFEANWAGAAGTTLLVGAYHFMSFESSGEKQAAHVIDTVPDGATLPIVVDLEYYGEFFDAPPSRELVASILDPLLQKLEDHYGTPPMIYATPEAYDRYLAGAYPDNPIWIRSIAGTPEMKDDRDWTLWQYSNRDRLDGYVGEEEYIDMNVYRGTREELAALVR